MLPKMAVARQPAEGDWTFGRYEALFRIAAGGMAEVFAARIQGESGFQKLVAIKRMLPHLAFEEQFVNMFLDEARVAANISSPNVVQTLDLGRTEDGSLYLVMDLVVGITLSTLLRNEATRSQHVPIPFAVEMIAQAAHGLDDAHEARTPTGTHLGIVHRDISPQNILVGIDGRARVTDFGIARAIMRRTATNTGQLKGKFSYFSPEQALGHQVDRRSDIFALGTVAWETLTSCRLFHHADNPLVSLERVKAMPIPAPCELRPEIPKALSDAILGALERDPDRRFQTAADFEAAVRAGARETGPHPSTRQLAAYVQEAGARSLARLQQKIEQALAGADAKTLARIDLSTLEAEPLTTPMPLRTVSQVRARELEAEQIADAATMLPLTTLKAPPPPPAPRPRAAGAAVEPASGGYDAGQTPATAPAQSDVFASAPPLASRNEAKPPRRGFVVPALVGGGVLLLGLGALLVVALLSGNPDTGSTGTPPSAFGTPSVGPTVEPSQPVAPVNVAAPRQDVTPVQPTPITPIAVQEAPTGPRHGAQPRGGRGGRGQRPSDRQQPATGARPVFQQVPQAQQTQAQTATTRAPTDTARPDPQTTRTTPATTRNGSGVLAPVDVFDRQSGQH